MLLVGFNVFGFSFIGGMRVWSHLADSLVDVFWVMCEKLSLGTI